jgi:release factor glutamine methyltransferase
MQATMKKSIVRFWLTLRHQVFDHRYRRLVMERIDSVPLIVLPDVFNPVLFRTGAALARAVQTTPLLDLEERQTPLALDLGCGSGVGAVFAAQRGARVIATDLNPEAVRCTRINALLNRFEDKIEARLGDLFEPVKDQRFDLILFNPPFYRGKPKDSLDLAWRGENIFERFAAGLKNHLTSSGRALLVFSTDGEYAFVLNELRKHGFAVSAIHQRDFGNEVITVYELQNPAVE